MKIGIVSGDWVHPANTHDGKEKWGGSGWVRLAQYLDLTPFEWVSGTLVWDSGIFLIKDAKDQYQFVDIIYMHRLMHVGLADNMKKAIASGQIIINDIDDWYWGLDTNNNAFKASHPKHNLRENTNAYRSILAASSMLTVSTKYLADRVNWVKCPKVVVKNTVDINRFTPHVHTDDKPVLGWVGSTAHRSSDLETVAGVLRPVYQNGDVLLHHSGHHESQPFFADRIGVPRDAVTTTPLSDHETYPSLLSMDIGIVPLRVTPFNQAKSDIKGLEYAAAGIPFIAQRIDSYQELHDTLGVGRLVDKPINWRKQISALLDYRVRQEEADRQREAIKSRDISFGAALITELLCSFR